MLKFRRPPISISPRLFAGFQHPRALLYTTVGEYSAHYLEMVQIMVRTRRHNGCDADQSHSSVKWIVMVDDIDAACLSFQPFSISTPLIFIYSIINRLLSISMVCIICAFFFNFNISPILAHCWSGFLSLFCVCIHLKNWYIVPFSITTKSKTRTKFCFIRNTQHTTHKMSSRPPPPPLPPPHHYHHNHPVHAGSSENFLVVNFCEMAALPSVACPPVTNRVVPPWAAHWRCHIRSPLLGFIEPEHQCQPLRIAGQRNQTLCMLCHWPGFPWIPEFSTSPTPGGCGWLVFFLPQKGDWLVFGKVKVTPPPGGLGVGKC